MRLVLLSDTHGLHREISVPGGDVLIHAGNYCSEGEVAESRSFGEFFRGLPLRHKVVTVKSHAALASQEEMPGSEQCSGTDMSAEALEADGWAPLEALADGIDLNADRCQSSETEEWLGVRGSIPDRSADDLSHELDVCDRDVHDDLGAVSKFVNARALGLEADGVKVRAWHQGIKGAGIDAEQAFPESVGAGRVANGDSDVGGSHCRDPFRPARD